MTKTITAEQAKQADELGYFLVPLEFQPEVEGRFEISGYRLFFFPAKDNQFLKHNTTCELPFNLNDEVYCEDEQEEWVDDNQGPHKLEPFKGSDKAKEMVRHFHGRPKETMLASLASKAWTVTGIEAVGVRNHKRSFDESRMIEEWHWKILMQENKRK